MSGSIGRVRWSVNSGFCVRELIKNAALDTDISEDGEGKNPALSPAAPRQGDVRLAGQGLLPQPQDDTEGLQPPRKHALWQAVPVHHRSEGDLAPCCWPPDNGAFRNKSGSCTRVPSGASLHITCHTVTRQSRASLSTWAPVLPLKPGLGRWPHRADTPKMSSCCPLAWKGHSPWPGQLCPVMWSQILRTSLPPPPSPPFVLHLPCPLDARCPRCRCHSPDAVYSLVGQAGRPAGDQCARSQHTHAHTLANSDL